MTDDSLLLGVWRYLVPVPPALWKGRVQAAKREGMQTVLSFMTSEHHLVRNFAVREMPRIGRPLEARDFAAKLNMPLERVVQILDDLEAHKSFVFRSDGQAVDWAYPVSIGPTPHHVAFSSGERIDAA